MATSADDLSPVPHTQPIQDAPPVAPIIDATLLARPPAGVPVPPDGLQGMPAPPPAASHLQFNLTQQASPVFIVHKNSGPSLLVRVIWFIFIGWWLGQLALLLGWALIVTVLGLPLGILILNRLPQVFTLRPYTEGLSVTQVAGATVVESRGHQQPSFWLRALYFVLVGWWLSLIWLEIAWLCGLSLVLLPLSFVMFSKVAAVTTLRRI